MKFCFWGSLSKGLIGKPIGGGEKQLALIALHLQELNHQVTIIDFDLASDTAIHGIKILSLSSRSKNNKKSYYIFYKLLKIVNADIYYGRIRSSIHLIPIIVAKRKKAKFIYHIAHDLDTLGFVDRWRSFYSKMPTLKKRVLHMIHSELLFPIVLRKATVVFAQNNEQYLNLKNIKTVNVTVVNNLFDKPILDKNHQVSIKTKDYFLVLGSLNLRKGIMSLKKLILANRERQFIIIGKAKDAKGAEFVSEIKTLKNVLYLPHQPQDVVFEYLKKATALVSTSFVEGFPNVFLESWSVGVPVLSLHVNPSNIISDYKLGVSFEGDLERMNKFIHDNSFDFIPDNLIQYVDNYHNSTLIVQNILKEIEKYD